MEKDKIKNNSFSSIIHEPKNKISTKSLFYPKRNKDKFKITAKLSIYSQKDKKIFKNTT